MKKLCFIWMACVVFYNSSVLAKKGPFFWEATKQGRVISILGTMHLFFKLQELQCSEQIIQSLSESSLVWTELDIKTVKKNFEKFEQQKLDPTGRDYQSLHPKSREFFESRQDKSELQKLSYYGLLHRLNDECSAEHMEYIHDIAPKVTVTTDTQWGELDIKIQTLARERKISQKFLDKGFPFESILFVSPFYTFADKKFVDRAVRNFNTNCTQDRVKMKLYKNKNQIEKTKKRFLSGYQIPIITLNILRTITLITIPKQIKYISQNKKHLLNKRNEYWLNKLLPAHQKHQKMFVAAGVIHFIEGHLVDHGKTLLDMLRKQGFEIKRYNTKCLAKEVKKNNFRGEDR